MSLSSSSLSTRTSQQQQQQGIDFRKALEILSLRSSSSARDTHDQENHCACHHHATPETKSLGQVIHLLDEDNSGGSNSTVHQDADRLEEQQKQIAQERAQRRQELERKLETMNVYDLLKAVLQAQEQRVQTYHTYNASLDTILQTHNLTHYPQACAEATAQFAVFSDTITCIQARLGDRNELVDLIKNLQQHEKEKLQLTAALHLEQIRCSCSQDDDAKITGLLEQGVQSLKSKIRDLVQDINDDIDEIKCALLDEE